MTPRVPRLPKPGRPSTMRFAPGTFWLLAIAVTLTGTCTMTIVVHQKRMLVDMGYGLTLAPPRPGEHSGDVMRSLGYSDAEISELARRGAVVLGA